VPATVEFPFRGSITVGELKDFYGVRIDASPKTSLDQVMRRELEPDRTKVDAFVDFPPLRFRIRELSDNGEVQLVGMSVLADGEPGGDPDDGESRKD
jgi:cell volume regulation protein A